METGQEEDVKHMAKQAAMVCVVGASVIVAGSRMKDAADVEQCQFGMSVSDCSSRCRTLYGSLLDTHEQMVDFRCGASIFGLHRPTQNVSLPQHAPSTLTLEGISLADMAALLVTRPINYTLCSVNVALFGSSGWYSIRIMMM